MTTKNATTKPAERSDLLPDALKTAYQAHTLAQMLYARVVTPQPWVPTVPAPYPQFLH